MPTRSLLWTALPNGLTADGKGLRLSVLLSPRLDPESAQPVLRSFDDFRSWPRVVSTAKFNARIGTTVIALGPSHVDASIGTPDAATWEALFTPDTPVRAFQIRDRTAHKVISYDTVGMHALMSDVYGKLASSAGDELPALRDLMGESGLGTIMKSTELIDGAFTVRGGFRNTRAAFDAVRDDSFAKKFPGIARTLAMFQLFHTPPNETTTQTVTPKGDARLANTFQTYKRGTIDAAQAVRDLDFHQIVSAMNQYPTLLRRLGLVFDFIIPRQGIAAGADMPVSVTVDFPSSPSSPSIGTQPSIGGITPAPSTGTSGMSVARAVPRMASPVTRAMLSATAFRPIPRPSPADTDLIVANGLLRLDDKRFALVQADVDGAGHKLMNFARTLTMQTSPARLVEPVTREMRRAGAPALRNAGLMLVHRGRGDALQRGFGRNATLDGAVKNMFLGRAGATAILYAEDLTRGWRVDIWEKRTGAWRSLCERQADYDIGRGAVTLTSLREEGTIRLAATGSTDGSNPDMVYLHEAIAVWKGWSLVARPPGRTIERDDTLRDGASDIPDGVRLRTSFTPAPGSLPRLRYGAEYAVRARVVDLAGNSLPPSTQSYPGDETSVAAATPYYRFEPVQPPTFALVGTSNAAEMPGPGESMARVAIRTFNEGFDDAAPSTLTGRRWAVAPRVSQREAETHGVLDGAAWGTPAQFAMLSTRDAELAQIAAPTTVVDEDGAPAHAAQYAVLGEKAQTLPYLPDPLCTHVVVRLLDYPLLDRTLTAPITIPLYPKGTSWPDAAPVLVRVYEPPRGSTREIPRFDEATRTLMVPLPKAVRARLRFASMLSPGALKLMGVWSWIPLSARTVELGRRAQNGELWPLTPWRDLAIVHAVQRPLLAPTIRGGETDRPLTATYLRIGLDATCHRASTDKLDLRAVWHEPRDRGLFAAPHDVRKDDVAFSIKITDPLGYNGSPDHVMPDAADTNRIAFGVEKVLTPEQMAMAPAKVHDFGDTRYRRVEYSLVGTSRFREYMSQDVLTEIGENGRRHRTDARITTDGPVAVIHVLNTSPPPAPEVLYVVPTFGWTRGATADGKKASWRRGSGLRVWLDRPWNATGYGEMLAVSLPVASATPVEPNDPPYKNIVTQWGNDAAWKSPFVSGVAPTLKQFPLARLAADPTGAWLPPGAPASEADQRNGSFAVVNLPHPAILPGATSGRVDIAPHDVYWDAERGLWYADIEIAHGQSYFPFVRLALARYQPSSVPGAHLSNITLADFASLAPDRWLSVTGTGTNSRQVRVFGFTHEESSGFHEAWPARSETRNPNTGKIVVHVPADISKQNVIEVWVEKLTASQGEDFGWQRVATGVESTMTETLAKGGDVVVRSADRVKRATELMSARKFDAVVSESLLDAAMELPTLWSGSVTLPAASPGGTRYRLVVAEYEEYLADGPDIYAKSLDQKGRRLVFVEHVELT